jgi:hypothetical protein
VQACQSAQNNWAQILFVDLPSFGIAAATIAAIGSSGIATYSSLLTLYQTYLNVSLLFLSWLLVAGYKCCGYNKNNMKIKTMEEVVLDNLDAAIESYFHEFWLDRFKPGYLPETPHDFSIYNSSEQSKYFKKCNYPKHECRVDTVRGEFISTSYSQIAHVRRSHTC